MSEPLSIADIIRWLHTVMPKGEVKNPWAAIGREVPVKALGRAVGIDRRDLFHMRDGDKKINWRQQQRLSRFIRDWENGMLEFKQGGAGKHHFFMSLVHRQTPRPRNIRMSVSWANGPKLTIAPRVAANPRIPQFRDLFVGLTTRQGRG